MPAANATPDDSLAQHLQSMLEEWNKYRSTWEARWARSWKRVNNVYEKEFAGSEGAGGRSKHFYGVTRQKCRVALSIVYETVFQQGRAPFDLGCTPITDSEDTAVAQATGQDSEQRVKGMKRLIDDQFVEAKLDTKLRSFLKTGIELGTSVIRGPFAVTRIRNAWVPRLPEGADVALEQLVAPLVAAAENARAAGVPPESIAQIEAQQQQAVQQFIEENRFYDLAQSRQIYPDFEPVDLWDVWLDPESEDIKDSIGVFERRVMDPEEFAALAKTTDGTGNKLYDRQAIEDILTANGTKGVQRFADMDLKLSRGPHRERLTYENFEREITAVTFSGRLPAHILDRYSQEHKGVDLTGGKKLADFEGVECVVEFCRGRIIRFSPNRYPRQRRLYYAFRWSKIAGSPYGWGLADELEHPQSVMNGFLRLWHDNKRLAASMGFVLREGKILNPGFSMTPGFKIMVHEETKPSDAFATITVPDVSINSLDGMKFCEDWANVCSGLPAFLEGDQIGHKANTAYEASELKASALKQLGVPIQTLDDDVIVPMVESVYDWNMQYSDAESAKGDFTIKATGFASFKDKTLRGAELRNLLNLYLQAPQLFPAINVAAILRELEKLGEMPEGKFVLPEEQAAEKQQQEQAGAQAATEAAAQAQRDAEAERIQLEAQARIAEQQSAEQAKAAEADKGRKHDVMMKVLDQGIKMASTAATGAQAQAAQPTSEADRVRSAAKAAAQGMVP